MNVYATRAVANWFCHSVSGFSGPNRTFNSEKLFQFPTPLDPILETESKSSRICN